MHIKSTQNNIVILSRGVRRFHAKKNGLHVALRTRNSGTESGRELFKCSKDSASLLVCTRKKMFCLGSADFFVSDIK